jgi:hypothetical protein
MILVRRLGRVSSLDHRDADTKRSGSVSKGFQYKFIFQNVEESALTQTMGPVG